MKYAEELPAELTRRLALARTQIERGEAFPLPFRYVMSILSVFGPRWHVPENEDEILQLLEERVEAALAPIRGWQRRAWNALLCAEKVVPQWNTHLIPTPPERWSTEDIVNLYSTDLSQLIQEGKFAVQHVVPSLLRYRRLVPEVQTVVDEASHLGFRDCLVNRAVFAYEAIESAKWIVGDDEDHEFEMGKEYPLHWSDEWTGRLSVYYSSAAFSVEVYDRELIKNQGQHLTTIRERNEQSLTLFVKNKERLREFWLWWIDEAVPASWYLRDLS